MALYLLHFVNPQTGESTRYRHAAHYLGYSAQLESRLLAHQNGCGARLTQVVLAHGLSFVLARVWPNGTLDDEKRFKRWHGSTRLCPICAQERAVQKLGLGKIQEETLFD